MEILQKLIGQGNDYTTACLLDYPYFKDNYKLIAIDLSKQQTLDDSPKATEQHNFTGNLDWAEGAWMVFVLKEVKKDILDFSQRTVRVLWMCYVNVISIRG